VLHFRIKQLAYQVKLRRQPVGWGESSTKITSKPAVELQALRESIAVLLQNEHWQESGTIWNTQCTECLCVINLPTALGVTSKVHNCRQC
jgi:hypothetical protein